LAPDDFTHSSIATSSACSVRSCDSYSLRFSFVSAAVVSSPVVLTCSSPSPAPPSRHTVQRARHPSTAAGRLVAADLSGVELSRTAWSTLLCRRSDPSLAMTRRRRAPTDFAGYADQP
jgi:hypothetical protein